MSDGLRTPPHQCPCGHLFDLMQAKDVRFNGGNFLNKSVEKSCMRTDSSEMEVQCPKCLLWFSDEDKE